MRNFFLLALVAGMSSYSFGQKLFAAKEKGSYGYVDAYGKWVIRPMFKDADAFCEGYGPVKQKQNWSFVSATGQIVAPFQFSKVYDFDGGVARVVISKEGMLDTYRLIDTTGRFVGNHTFRHIRKFSERGLAMAKPDVGDWGFIDRKGAWVIKPEFGGLREFHDGLAMARKRGKWGYIDETGAWVIQPIYNHVNKFSEGIASVETKDGWILIDKQGQRVGTLAFSLIRPFSDGVAVARDRKWGVVNKQGKWLVEPTFDFLDSFTQGYARAREHQLWGAISKSGTWLIKPIYDNVLEFSDGMARVKQDNLWGYVDLSGRWVVEPRFASAEKFRDGSAIVKVKGNWGIIDRSGKFTAEPTFDKLRSLVEDGDVEEELTED